MASCYSTASIKFIVHEMHRQQQFFLCGKFNREMNNLNFIFADQYGMCVCVLRMFVRLFVATKAKAVVDFSLFTRKSFFFHSLS